MNRVIGILALLLIFSATAVLAQDQKGKKKLQQNCDLKTVAVDWMSKRKAFKTLGDALTALAGQKMDDKEFGFDEVTRASGLEKAQQIVAFKEQFDKLVAQIAPRATRECAVCELRPHYENAKKGGFNRVTWKDLRDVDLRLLFSDLATLVSQRNTAIQEKANISDRVKVGQLDRRIEEIEENIKRKEADIKRIMDRGDGVARPEELFSVAADSTICK